MKHSDNSGVAEAHNIFIFPIFCLSLQEKSLILQHNYFIMHHTDHFHTFKNANIWINLTDVAHFKNLTFCGKTILHHAFNHQSEPLSTGTGSMSTIMYIE